MDALLFLIQDIQQHVHVYNNNVNMGWAGKGEKKTAHFKVKLSDISSTQCKVHVTSIRGGHKVQEITIP